MHSVSCLLNNFKDEVGRMIIGQTIVTTYNNQTYKVTDIEWNLNPKASFIMDGRKISYAKYFQKVFLSINIEFNCIRFLNDFFRYIRLKFVI
jgi:hypothetical protein